VEKNAFYVDVWNINYLGVRDIFLKNAVVLKARIYDKIIIFV
jgi:hypothetical protein